MAEQVNFMTHLINPDSLQSIMTKACRSGLEIPLPDDVVTPMGSPASGAAALGDVNGQEEAKVRYAPPTETPGTAIRCAVLMAKDGNLMSYSEGLKADKASFYSALASKMWEQQVNWAKDMETIMAGNDPINSSATLDTSSNYDDNRNGKNIGGLNFILSMHDTKQFVVAPCYTYLVLMIGDFDFPTGLLKNRCLALASRMKEPMEKVTPEEFSNPHLIDTKGLDRPYDDQENVLNVIPQGGEQQNAEPQNELDVEQQNDYLQEPIMNAIPDAEIILGEANAEVVEIDMYPAPGDNGDPGQVISDGPPFDINYIDDERFLIIRTPDCEQIIAMSDGDGDDDDGGQQ